MGSTTTGEMLSVIRSAQGEHEQLWRDTWKMPNGGTTAGLLDDLRSAEERFGACPPSR